MPTACLLSQTLGGMNNLTFRVVGQFPEPAFSALTEEAFSDYETSKLLTDVASQEAASKQGTANAADEGALRIGAFRADSLVGWTFARSEGTSHLYMINSGVTPAERHQGIYSELVRLVIEHARLRGYVAILSRHAANNNAVIVAKLKLGFFISGFEYSEVYGPLVRLTFLVGELRRSLYKTRSAPIRRANRRDA